MSGDALDLEIPMFVTGCDCDHYRRARYEARLWGLHKLTYLPPLKGGVGYTDCCPWLAGE